MSPDVVINGLNVGVISSQTNAVIVVDHPRTVVHVEPQRDVVVLHQGAQGKSGTLTLEALTSDPETPQVGQIWIRIDL